MTYAHHPFIHLVVFLHVMLITTSCVRKREREEEKKYKGNKRKRAKFYAQIGCGNVCGVKRNCLFKIWRLKYSEVIWLLGLKFFFAFLRTHSLSSQAYIDHIHTNCILKINYKEQ